jgi:superoxide dismutase, Fe-Mn family
MATALFRNSVVSTARRVSVNAAPTAPIASTNFIRGKATLPDLPCKLYTENDCCNDGSSLLRIDDYAALEPSISGKIMELHHKNHHNTYVTSYNQATEKFSEADAKNDIAAKIALQPLINFHGGGHLNHSLFWENLAPKKSGGGEPPSGSLGKAIDETYGSLDEMKKKFNTALAGIQGSGWAWLVKDTQTGHIGIKTYAVGTIARLQSCFKSFSPSLYHLEYDAKIC